MAGGLIFPDILGIRYSRTSAVDISIDNDLIIEGCTGFTLGRKLTRGKSWGKAAKAQARTRGKFNYSLKMSVYTDDYELIKTYLISKDTARNGIFSVSFTLSISMFEDEIGTTIWQLLGCSIADDDEKVIEDSQYGSDLGVDLDFDVMEVLKDGISAGRENVPFGQIGA